MNSNIRRRLKKIEDTLGVNKKHLIVLLTDFGNVDGELPPERTENGITIRYVHYTDLK